MAEGWLLTGETRRTFGTLSTQQVNWKPDAGEWSVGQCFDHLIVSNHPYFAIIEEIRQGKRRPRLRERLPLLPVLFGKMLIDTLRPDSGRKVKARKAFLPSSSQIDPGIVARFVEQEERLLGLMETTRGLDLDGMVITSPVVSFVTYSLMDAYRIGVAHAQNHFVQARRVLETQGFPA